MIWKQIENCLDEMIEYQQKCLLAQGRQLVDGLTSDDILQPNDFPDLEVNPHFRYEEGQLAGLQSARIALSALKKEISN
ncbi:putative uncharacterized protein [Parachlamydia acanthamoebae UV-7]|uniref:Uncharacterized protein n=4 Tax=Parachlamydia TaxID=83551 RepID=F8KYP4_PARAV|nr:hypothetical protein [Parachlamydia acanthamoebae]EFB41137.1 hypothetical protein pah_c050o111 [Parachlamydia acanthamoebae str. Hall's coccus]KIA78298.1 hypothetical protein DB43_EI00430 [Parachlamydia acanthamoebae]CCB85999.1 putative uncharacterized protein [Parachlamydia acanthamoebae UV-7]